MSLYIQNSIKIAKDITNKKYVPELPKVKNLTKSVISSLKPQRDIDGNIIVYSINKGQLINYNLCDSGNVNYHNHSEKGKDFFRQNELYNIKNDAYYYPLSFKYDINDVPLGFSYLKNILNIRNKFIDSSYYPSKYLPKEEETYVKYIYFREEVIPNITHLNFDDNKEEINLCAKYAIDAWEKGMPINQIIRILEKSMLKTNRLPKPDINLFHYLMKYPNLRSLFVQKIGNEEFFNSDSAMYYDIFSSFYFDSEQQSVKVLKQCGLTDNNLSKKQKEQIKNVVGLLRRRKFVTKENYERVDYYIKALYDKDLPWTEKDEELIKRTKEAVKNNDEDVYKAIIFLLREQDCSTDFILNNLKDTVLQLKQNNKNNEMLNNLLDNEELSHIAKMDNKTLVTQIRAKLLQLGLKEEKIEKSMRHFEKLFPMIDNNFDLCNKIIKMSLCKTPIKKEIKLSAEMLRCIKTELKQKSNLSRIEKLYEQHFPKSEEERELFHRAFSQLWNNNYDKNQDEKLRIIDDLIDDTAKNLDLADTSSAKLE